MTICDRMCGLLGAQQPRRRAVDRRTARGGGGHVGGGGVAEARYAGGPHQPRLFLR